MSELSQNLLLPSMGSALRVIIIGASGGIGNALMQPLRNNIQVTEIYALSRSSQTPKSDKIKNLKFDFTDEQSIINTAQTLRESGSFDLIIMATGLLQGEGISPEKNMRALRADSMMKSYQANTIGPALTAKHFLPLLKRGSKTVFAALSTRVGSISDNRLGGWYAYRASKAALNMTLKTLSIEFGRRYPEAIIAGLHPGTVDTQLSRPFQGNVPEGKLFTPQFCADSLISVIDGLGPHDSGNLFAWDGQKIPF